MHRLIVSAAVLITLVGTAARAEEGTMRVRLGDLNIREEAGAQVALRRIKAASSNRVLRSWSACRIEKAWATQAPTSWPTNTTSLMSRALR